MTSLIIISSLVLGAIFGSFLLVVSLRYNTGKSLQGRSQCFSCHKKLRWFELVPIVSYVVQKGCCRRCHSLIPQETIVAEGVTAVTFSAISARGLFVGNPDSIFSLEYTLGSLYLFILFSILMVIFFYDIHHKIIPDKLSFSFGFLAFIGSFFFEFQKGILIFSNAIHFDLWHVAGGVLVPLPFALLWLFSKGRLMGLGDPKLMVGIGFLMGVVGGFSAVFVSFWVGSLFIISAMIIQKIFNRELFMNMKKGIMKKEVPFGPFLILGTLLTLVFDIRLF